MEVYENSSKTTASSDSTQAIRISLRSNLLPKLDKVSTNRAHKIKEDQNQSC